MTIAAAVILAAGLGTRMKSARPKVMNRIAGRTLIAHAAAAAAAAGVARAIIVTGPDMGEVLAEARLFLPQASGVIQAERKGTGHAVMQALPDLAHITGTVLILYGDTPLLTAQTLEAVASSVSRETLLAVLGFEAADPHGYGRLIRRADGRLAAIREELDASPAETAIREVNSGVIAIDAGLLRRLLPRIGNDNAKGEYYLTDLIGLAAAEGHPAAVTLCPEDEVQGVNTRAQLAAAERVMQDRLRAAALDAGATLVAPETVFFTADTVIGRDSLIEPHVVFGPGVRLGEGVTIRAFSHLEGALVADGAIIGPYARLRPGADIGAEAHIGNFVEVKASRIGAGAKANHLTYLGDADVGAGSNIGAGTITCNYDGFGKHRTVIGERAFIGSNSSLVAPVSVGDGAYIGSGSVITRDVPADALALERSEQQVKPGWAAKFRALRGKRKSGQRSE